MVKVATKKFFKPLTEILSIASVSVESAKKYISINIESISAVGVVVKLAEKNLLQEAKIEIVELTLLTITFPREKQEDLFKVLVELVGQKVITEFRIENLIYSSFYNN